MQRRMAIMVLQLQLQVLVHVQLQLHHVLVLAVQEVQVHYMGHQDDGAEYAGNQVTIVARAWYLVGEREVMMRAMGMLTTCCHNRILWRRKR